ncbi:hypothetical protein CCHL11_08144, partial [Colletotrichum chlorophyti]
MDAMGLSKVFKSLKKQSRHPSGDAGGSSVHGGKSVQTLVPTDEARLSVGVVLSSPPSRADQRTSRLDLDSPAASDPSPILTTQPPQPLEQTAHVQSKTAPSLWGRAYEALREKDGRLVDRYERLLSRELLEHVATSTTMSQHMPNQDNDLDHAENRIPTDHDTRCDQLQKTINQGLQRADKKKTKYTIFGREFVLGDQISVTLKLVQAIKGVVDEAVKASPEASLAWAGVCVLLPVITNPSAAEEANRNGLFYVSSRMRYYVEFESLLWPVNLKRAGFKGQIDSHIKHILEFQIKSVLRFYGTWLARVGRDMILCDGWQELLEGIKGLEQIIWNESQTVNILASRDTLEAIRKAAEQHSDNMQSLLKEHLQVFREHLDIASRQLDEQRRINEILEDRRVDLPVVLDACHDSDDVQQSPRCEDGTRRGILQTIAKRADENSAETLFWLAGPAGTGKSTIARTVAASFAGENRVVAGYFFKRGEQGRNDPTRLFPTLAKQLAEAITAFKRPLKAVSGNLWTVLIKKQWKRRASNRNFNSFLGALCQKCTSPTPVDQCERPDRLLKVIELLDKMGTISTSCLRVLVTSRSTPTVMTAFKRIRYRSLNLEEDHRDETQTDVATFLKTRFANIENKQLDRLIHLSTTPSPLFIYAATLCRFIDDPDEREDPIDQLDLWLQQCDMNAPQLSQIYLPIIHYVLFGSYNTLERPKPLPETHRTELFDVLGAVVLVATPLSHKAIAGLLNITTHRVILRLRNLHAVLSIPQDTDALQALLGVSYSTLHLARNCLLILDLWTGSQTPW